MLPVKGAVNEGGYVPRSGGMPGRHAPRACPVLAHITLGENIDIARTQ